MRYIDVDKAIARIEASPAFPNFGQDGYFLREVTLNILDGQPTADVVPKSEYDVLQDLLDAAIAGQKTLQKHLVNVRADVVEIFSDIERVLDDNYCGEEWKDYPTPYYRKEVKEDIVELKKKYPGVD